MMKMLLPVMTVLLLWQGAASLDGLCRECLCANANGHFGNADQCSMPTDPTVCQDNKFCGPYGMTHDYWIDGGQQGSDFYSCMGDWDCANKTLNNYVDKYCISTIVGHSAPCSCEEQARLHHCGPYSLDAAFCNDYYNNYFGKCMSNSW